MQSNSRKKKEESSTDLFSYLETLPRSSILALYQDPSRGQYAAKTILQKLPELARQCAIRLSVCGGKFPYKSVAAWSSSKTKRDVKVALSRMHALCVINPVKLIRDDEDDDKATVDTSIKTSITLENIDPGSIISLSDPFYEAIKKSLTSFTPAPYPELSSVDLETCVQKEKLNPSKKKNSKYQNTVPTPTELETFTQRRWDSVLHYLVGTDDGSYEDPPEAIQQFLETTGLMQEDPDYRGNRRAPLIISSKGYEFMLQDVHVQVWQFILKYIQMSIQNRIQKCEQQGDIDGQTEEFRKESLLFLICLSYFKVGKGYPMSALPKDKRSILKDFSLFGLLYICKIGGATIFFPTRVAVNLVVGGLSGGAASDGGSTSESTSVAALSSSAAATRVLENALDAPIPGKNHIAIIVQTNFQVCAYTTSPLHLKMLGIFCDCTTFRRLPNVIFYRITRDSIKGAFKLGIEARQILRFLKMHAHPRLRTGDQPLLAANVEDQIILWDRERSRVKMQEVYSLQCKDEKEYEAVKQYAQDHEAFGWGSATKLRIMIDYEKAEKTILFVRRWRTKIAKR